MPILEMNCAYRNYSDKEWLPFIKQWKRRVVAKAGLMKAEIVSSMLTAGTGEVWDLERIERKARLQGQRAFWLFRFTDGDWVYPSEVLRELIRDA